MNQPEQNPCGHRARKIFNPSPVSFSKGWPAAPRIFFISLISVISAIAVISVSTTRAEITTGNDSIAPADSQVTSIVLAQSPPPGRPAARGRQGIRPGQAKETKTDIAEKAETKADGAPPGPLPVSKPKNIVLEIKTPLPEGAREPIVVDVAPAKKNRTPSRNYSSRAAGASSGESSAGEKKTWKPGAKKTSKESGSGAPSLLYDLPQETFPKATTVDDFYYWQKGKSLGTSKKLDIRKDEFSKPAGVGSQDEFKLEKTFYMVLIKESTDLSELKKIASDLELNHFLDPEIKKTVSFGREVYWLTVGHYTTEYKAFNKAQQLREKGYESTLVTETVRY